ncbi:MAG: hypothetical protein AAF191_01070, partial [Verrucomicrobiota bacterium]
MSFSSTVPGLIVFDLDLTLWSCGGLWIDCTQWPFTQREDGTIIDGSGSPFTLYPDVSGILADIDSQG